MLAVYLLPPPFLLSRSLPERYLIFLMKLSCQIARIETGIDPMRCIGSPGDARRYAHVCALFCAQCFFFMERSKMRPAQQEREREREKRPRWSDSSVFLRWITLWHSFQHCVFLLVSLGSSLLSKQLLMSPGKARGCRCAHLPALSAVCVFPNLSPGIG